MFWTGRCWGRSAGGWEKESDLSGKKVRGAWLSLYCFRVNQSFWPASTTPILVPARNNLSHSQQPKTTSPKNHGYNLYPQGTAESHNNISFPWLIWITSPRQGQWEVTAWGWTLPAHGRPGRLLLLSDGSGLISLITPWKWVTGNPVFS